MKNIAKMTALALGFAFSSMVFAQEAPVVPVEAEQEVEVGQPAAWNLSLGVSYRHFKGPKFKSTKLKNDISAVSNYDSTVKGSVESVASSIGRGLMTVTTVDGAKGNAGHGSYGDGEYFGFVIGGSFTLMQEESMTISLVGNFSYYDLDSQSRHAALGGTTSVSSLWALDGRPAVVDRGDFAGDYALYDTAVTGSLTSWNKMSMDLYVLDLGASIGFDFDNNLGAFIALGPTITLADMNSSSRNDDGTHHKNENEFEFGVYVSGGASFWFNEKFGVSLEVRYDKAFGEVGTRYFTQDLDTIGGMLKLLCRF